MKSVGSGSVTQRYEPDALLPDGQGGIAHHLEIKAEFGIDSGVLRRAFLVVGAAKGVVFIDSCKAKGRRDDREAIQVRRGERAAPEQAGHS